MAGKSKTKVAVLFGGVSSEHDVSVLSGKNVIRGLDQKKYTAYPVKITRRGQWVVAKQKPKSMMKALEQLKGKVNVAFIALHGRAGEDGTIQAALEIIQLPYTGSGVAASALAINKHLSNLIFQASGFHVPSWVMISHGSKLPTLRLPQVIKPLDGGSSVGITVAHTRHELVTSIRRMTKIGDQVIVQQYIKGRELACGVLETRPGHAVALMPTEIRPKTATWFDYRAKYTTGATEEITPAPLTTRQKNKIQLLALRAHTLLGCRGMSRSDFILSNGEFWILETNTIPGLTNTSLLPQGASASGITFPKLLEAVITSAVDRNE